MAERTPARAEKPLPEAQKQQLREEIASPYKNYYIVVATAAVAIGAGLISLDPEILDLPAVGSDIAEFL